MSATAEKMDGLEALIDPRAEFCSAGIEEILASRVLKGLPDRAGRAHG